jgi:hypothetical protein
MRHFVNVIVGLFVGLTVAGLVMPISLSVGVQPSQMTVMAITVVALAFSVLLVYRLRSPRCR